MNQPVRNLFKGGRHVRSPGMLSADEEHQLILAWQERGDSGARDRLIRAFAPLASSVANRFDTDFGGSVNDLIQQANIGLMKAVDRFDTARGNRFATYAVWWMRAELQDYARSNKSVVRRPNSPQVRAAERLIAGAKSSIKADQGDESSELDNQIAAALGVDFERAATLRRQVSTSDFSLNAPAGGEDGAEHLEFLVDPSSVGDPIALMRRETQGQRRVLVDALEKLPARERDIIISTQVKDPADSLEKLGVKYGISKERVRQLRERALARLREHLLQRGLGPEYLL